MARAPPAPFTAALRGSSRGCATTLGASEGAASRSAGSGRCGPVGGVLGLSRGPPPRGRVEGAGRHPTPLRDLLDRLSDSGARRLAALGCCGGLLAGRRPSGLWDSAGARGAGLWRSGPRPENVRRTGVSEPAGGQQGVLGPLSSRGCFQPGLVLNCYPRFFGRVLAWVSFYFFSH